MKLNSTILNNNILELNELIKIESILQWIYRRIYQ
jgi:hypothetical protein